MCLIVFSCDPEHKFPIILSANRDEFYRRPALPVHSWQDHPEILGGRDLEAGGSWLAVNTSGRFAAVTNYREWPLVKGQRSRGELVSDFLSRELSAQDYLSSVVQKSQLYSGFNLLLGDSSGIFYYSNRSTDVSHFLSLQPGTYGLCNHLLDTPWPKLVNTRNRFAEIIRQPDLSAKPLIELMRDSSKPDVNELPDTGVGLDREILLSSCFITSESYGTRNTSILMMNSSGSWQWTEQNYKGQGEPGDRLFFDTSHGYDNKPSAEYSHKITEKQENQKFQLR